MFQAAVRAAVRPAAHATRSTIKSTSQISKTAIRTFSLTSTRLSGGPETPKFFGPGAPSGEVPTDELQATGLDRLELLAEMQGVELFEDAPLDSSRLGTLADPIKVYSLVRVVLFLSSNCARLFIVCDHQDTERIIGCTGSPADSHEVHWFKLLYQKDRRCPECGSGEEHNLFTILYFGCSFGTFTAYSLDFQGDLEFLAAQDAAGHH
jgi:cytochrome c oxidase subunit 5b